MRNDAWRICYRLNACWMNGDVFYVCGVHDVAGVLDVGHGGDDDYSLHCRWDHDCETLIWEPGALYGYQHCPLFFQQCLRSHLPHEGYCFLS